MHWYNYAIALPIVVFLFASEAVALYWLLNPLSRDEFSAKNRIVEIVIIIGAFLCTATVVAFGVSGMVGWVANSSVRWFPEEPELRSWTLELAIWVSLFATIGLAWVYGQVSRIVREAKRSEYVDKKVGEHLVHARGLTSVERAMYAKDVERQLLDIQGPASCRKSLSDYDSLRCNILTNVMDELNH